MKCRLVNENFRDHYLERLLTARGVENVEDYLKPDKKYLQSPDALCNIAQGAELLWDVIKKNGKVLIVVDSDVDGFTSASIMELYLRQIAPELDISHVLHKGKQHGLEDHIQNLLDSDIHYDLVILPDSSSNDKEYHDELGAIGTKVLVLDHHITDKALSDNAVIINNQLSPDYRNKELTGAGVTFQFCRYIDEHYGLHSADPLIDLAALGVCGDMGSVLDMENRYIMTEGFAHITNKYFRALCEKQEFSMGGKVNPISVAFYIVPLINAMIRVGTQDEKERVYLAFVDGDALVPCNKRGAKGTMERVSVESARECTNAHAKQKRILEQAVNSIEQKIYKNDLLENRILFVRLDDDDTFPSQLNGLVAMQLTNRFKRPAMVTRVNSEGYCRGSMRGLNQSALTDFKSFLEQSGLFEYVAGHANAAGLSILNSDLSAFHSYANEALKDIDFGENCYDINFQRGADDEDLDILISELCKYEGLWGQQNSEPMINVRNIYVKKQMLQIMGKNQDTVKCMVNGVAYMFFHAKDFISKLDELGDDIKLEVVGRPNMNEWMGTFTPQIFVSDYEVRNDSITEF